MRVMFRFDPLHSVITSVLRTKGESIMEQFSAYGHALFSVVIWIVVVQLLSAWVGAAKAKVGGVPGATPEADYSNKF